VSLAHILTKKLVFVQIPASETADREHPGSA